MEYANMPIINFDVPEHESRCNTPSGSELSVEGINFESGHAEALPIDFQDDDDWRYVNFPVACRIKSEG